MLSCEGYKMFYGTVTINPKNSNPSFDLTGTWLYKPEHNCWYCQPDMGFSRSFTADILTNFRDDAA